MPCKCWLDKIFRLTIFTKIYSIKWTCIIIQNLIFNVWTRNWNSWHFDKQYRHLRKKQTSKIIFLVFFKEKLQLLFDKDDLKKLLVLMILVLGIMHVLKVRPKVLLKEKLAGLFNIQNLMVHKYLRKKKMILSYLVRWGQGYSDMPICNFSDRWAGFNLALKEKTKLSVITTSFIVWKKNYYRKISFNLSVV